ncbi:MAG TPA: FtsK/SpoIIIE domain-containing protein [Tepidisphaeraceae bacterium]|nr:FtsK/SpoIIIE domain-containing protein [Tepidisphaeraceae bacterium]
MTTTTTPPESATTESVTSTAKRDQQRDALRDLVALATECATTEAQIDRKLQSTVEDATKELEKAKWAIEQRFNSSQDAAKTEYQTRTKHAKASYKAAMVKLEEEDENARRRIDSANDPIERKLKEKLQQAAWEAESVFDIAQNSIKKEVKKRKEASEQNQATLDELDARAKTVESAFGGKLQLPPATEPFDVGKDPSIALASQLEAARLGLQRMESLAGGGALGGLKRLMTKNKAADAYGPFRRALDNSHAAHKANVEFIARYHEYALRKATDARKSEVQRAKEKLAPMMEKQRATHAAQVQQAKQDYDQKSAQLEAKRDGSLDAANDWFASTQDDNKQKMARELQAASERQKRTVQQAQAEYDAGRNNLESRLTDGLANSQAPIGNGQAGSSGAAHEWTDPAYWANWKSPTDFPAAIPFGKLHVDLKAIADQIPRQGELRLKLPLAFDVAAALPFPDKASLMIDYDRTGRERAISVLQNTMARLLTMLPPGRVRFTIIDPVGLGQNFAGFMHLQNHDEALVGSRILTESEDIEKRLADLTEHMETVIQKYLRNEFASLDDYNIQAGELAEPYRFLVISDFPTAFEGESYRRLSSIAASGARCGVHLLIARDNRVVIPDSLLDDLSHNAITIAQQGENFVFTDKVFGQFPLALDAPPPDEMLTNVLEIVGKGAKLAKRVEVNFDTIAPKFEEFWTRSSADELVVPVGRMGATRLQSLRLGRGVAQHVLIAGKTGSGKSTLLHAMVTNLAMWFSPDEVEVYLIDFKKGVEFKTYADTLLPHARAIAIESDREFGLSVLQRLDGELVRRGDLYKKANAQDLAGYRKSPGSIPMPRTLLIIDEFQEFFTEDDRIAQEASLLLERLVRQGRAFGIHVILGSQTIGGTSGLSRATIGQMAVRIALMTSEADSQMILGDNNSAARLLSRPGEAIYNDAGGLVEGNSPFQVAYLNDDRRDQYLDRIHAKVTVKRAEPIIFEGNAPADILKNKQLAALVAADSWKTVPVPIGWMGDPVAIKDPTGIAFRRQSGSNILLIGQQDDEAMAIISDMMLSLGVQQSPAEAMFYIFDGSPVDSPLASVLPSIKSAMPHEVKLIDFRGTADTLAELGAELLRRRESETPGPSIYVIFYGLQRYRILRKGDDFAFSAGSDEKAAAPDKLFVDMIREGPNEGIHTIAWADTPSSIDRTLDRTSLREFDNRVLFQMSAADSSNLIDSPMANKLGMNRALIYSEEQGLMEKFRPYALPPKQWLENYQAKLAARPGATARPPMPAAVGKKADASNDAASPDAPINGESSAGAGVEVDEDDLNDFLAKLTEEHGDDEPAKA